MPVNGMEIGSDVQIVIVDSVQGLLTFNILTMVDLKQLTRQIKSTALDGLNRYADLPEGWASDIDFDKADGNLLNYVVANEAAYFSGATVGNITMSVSIADANGTQNQYRLTGGTLKLGSAFSAKGLDKVTSKASLTFSRIYATS